jgi:hypothetical protein
MTIVSVRVKRHRKLSLGAVLKQAKAAGQAVRGAVIRSDAIELQFGEPAEQPKRDDEVERWIKKHAH